MKKSKQEAAIQAAITRLTPALERIIRENNKTTDTPAIFHPRYNYERVKKPDTPATNAIMVPPPVAVRASRGRCVIV